MGKLGVRPPSLRPRAVALQGCPASFSFLVKWERRDYSMGAPAVPEWGLGHNKKEEQYELI